MKIVIAGAGAMGSRFAIMLKRGGNNVTLIDGWPAHIEAIREHGLRANLNGEEIAVPFSIYSQNEIPTTVQADLILVFTKAMQLDQMMQTIKPMIGEQTKVLCLLNGIGHEDTIEKYVSTDKIFLGNTIWTADLIGPGNVRLFGDGSVELQNIEPGKEEDARQLAAVLADAGLNASYSREHPLLHLSQSLCQRHPKWFVFDFKCEYCPIRSNLNGACDGPNDCGRICGSCYP